MEYILILLELEHIRIKALPGAVEVRKDQGWYKSHAVKLQRVIYFQTLHLFREVEVVLKKVWNN